jgi:chromosome segregation ATPase
LKDYWFLNAAIALGTGSVLGLLINPWATPAIGCACALTSVGSFWVVKRIEKRRLDRSGKSLQAKIHHLNTRAQTLQQNILVAEDQRNRLQLEIASHQNQVMALEAARKRIAGETETIEAQLIALQSEKELLVASIDYPQIAATKAVNNLEQNNRTKDRLAAQQESLATLAAEIAERSMEHHQLNRAVTEIQADRDAILTEREELQLHLTNLRGQEQQLEQSLQHLQTQVTQQSILQTQVTELHQERQQLQESIDWLRTDRDQIIGQSQSQLQELLEKEQALQRSVKELQQEAVKFEQTQERVDTLYKEWQQLEDSMAQLAIDKVAKEAEVEAMQPILQQLALSRTQFMTEVAELTVHKQHLGESLEQLVAEKALKEAEIETIQPALQELEQSRNQLLAELSELNAESNQLGQLLAQLSSQKAVVEAEVAAIEPTVKILEQSREQLMAEVAELRSQKERLARSAESVIVVPEPLFPDLSATPWQERFEDEHIRAVFEHLHEYGSLTEAELTQMLEGNPRKARQFALKFDEYLMQVPFAARVEVGAAGKRYVRN